MYVIIDRKSKAILHMSNSFPDEEKKPEDLYPPFDAATMEFGRSPAQFVPGSFFIEDGIIKDAAATAEVPPTARAAAVPPHAETLVEARQRKLREFSEESLTSRRRLVPDYEMLNAGLGIYDGTRLRAIRDTVEAFRAEYHRLEKMVDIAHSIEALDAIRPQFPKEMAASR